MKKNTIFVQIASYRDPELIPTLDDMIGHAKHKNNLRTVVCWQHGDDEKLEDFIENNYTLTSSVQSLYNSYDEDVEFTIHYLEKDGAKVELLDLPYWSTHGACWARNLIQQYYSKEKYTMQLDSHHRFIEHWDIVLIDMLESLRIISPKPVLTAYVPSFDPDNDPAARVRDPWKMDFDRFIPEGAVFFRPSTIDDWRDRDMPMLSRFYSAHFAFADGKFAEEVQHDPQYFFHGEEISIAARAFTHGYDLYHPHRVVVWHEYTRKKRTKVWDDHTTPNRNKGLIKEDWTQRNDKCHKRNRILFGMDGEDPKQIKFGKYGFGKERTLKEYEEYAGISFKYRGVQQDVLDRKEPILNDYKTYKDDAEWKSTISKSNDVRICFMKTELGEILDDYDFWYVGVHDADYNEIHRKDFTAAEIRKFMNDGNPWVDQRFIYISPPDRKAVTFTVWPHSKSKGWMERIMKDVNHP